MKLKKALLVSSAAIALTGASAPSFAAGTAANDPITNTINISYDSDGIQIDQNGAASDEFTVDEKIAFTLNTNDTPTNIVVNPAEQDVTLTFALTNTGNAVRDFDINIAQTDNGAPIGLTLDATGSGNEGTYSVYTSPNETGGPDTLYDPSGVGGVGPLAADGVLYVKIKAHVPQDSEQDQEDIFDVTAQPLNTAGNAKQAESTAFDPGTMEAVYGDADQDGIETGQEQFTVSSAKISATKTVAVVSENRDGDFNCAFDAAEGGDAYIPGACLAYTITLTNDISANEDADDFTFTDVFPSGVTFQSVEPGHTFDSVTSDAASITGSVTKMLPGESATVTFRVLID